MINTTKSLYIMLILSFIIISCKQNAINPIVGSWTIKEDSNEGVALVFSKYSTFEIFFKRGDYFKGTYSIHENTISLVDNYCGTKLKGKYGFSIEGDLLSLSVINDPYCGRTDFFPTVWIKKDDSIQKKFDKNKIVSPDTIQVK